MPSKPTHYGLIDDGLKRKLDYAVAKYDQVEHSASDGPNAELLCILLDISQVHFDDDDVQAQCALRRYLLRYRWSLETSDAELEKAGIELHLPVQSVLV